MANESVYLRITIDKPFMFPEEQLHLSWHAAWESIDIKTRRLVIQELINLLATEAEELTAKILAEELRGRKR